MKTKQQIKEKEFDTVKTFRAIKEKISKDISNMTLPEIQEYLRQQKKTLTSLVRGYAAIFNTLNNPIWINASSTSTTNTPTNL